MRRCLSWAFVLLYCLAAVSPLSHRTGDAGPPGRPDGSASHPGFLYLELVLDRCLPDDDDDASAPLIILKKKRAVLRHSESGPVPGDDSAGFPQSSDTVTVPGPGTSRDSGPAPFVSHVLLSRLASGLSPPHCAS